jgi:serine/threonine protein kinase
MTESADRQVSVRVRAVFEGAMDVEPESREAFLARECGDDTALLSQVRRLIDAHAQAESFLEQPLAAVPAPPPSLPNGRRLGPYELVRELGRGGMGVVYLARRIDGQFERDVAVKVVPASAAGLDTSWRFSQERQILASLAHPGIAQLHDAGTTDDGVSYVVMEHVAGEPIDAYCQRRGLSIAARLDLVADVCDAVHFAHRNLVVHRDLKPSNIFVTSEGAIKLLDFGIAKLLEPGPSREATHTGAQPMTPVYASPEQVRGERVTTATDVYALGLLLYELLTGHRAHDLKTSSLDEIVRVVCQTEPARPSAAVARTGSEHGLRRVGLADSPQKLTRQLSGDLDTIVMTALRKEPDRRYPGALELAQDLRRYRDDRPISARIDTWAYRSSKFVRRHAWPVAGVAVTFVALTAALIVTLWQAREADRARRDADAQRARAEQRLNDVHALATSFVFEFHDAIATLAGATQARQLVVSKGLNYLDILAKETVGDRALQRDLADAYDRMAGIQSSPYESNVGDLAGGLASSVKALAVREALAAGTAANSPERQAVVAGYLRLGDAYQSGGRAKDALDAYRRVVIDGEAVLAVDAANMVAGQQVAAAANRLCGVLLAVGDGASALAACDKSEQRYAALLAADPGNASIREAAAGLRLARVNALRLTGRTAEALAEVAIAATMFRQLVADAPANAPLRMRLATVLTQQAVVQLAEGRESDAIVSNREAVALLDGLRAGDPGNARVNALLSFVLLRQAPSLVRAGLAPEAAMSTRRGLEILRAQAERPGAGPSEKNDYAAWLLTCEPPSERRPEVALRLARQVVDQQRHPVFLDTLALALFRTGNPAEAIKVGEAALGLLPAVPAGAPATGLRAEIEGHLKEYRAAAAPSRP